MKGISTLAFFLAAQILAAQNGIVWQPPATVAPASFGNAHPRIALDAAGNPLVLWGKEGANQAYFSRWSGTAFSAPVAVNPAQIPVFAASWGGPDLASHGDTVYITYKKSPEIAQNPIYLIRSFDGGATFSAPVQVETITDSISRFTTVTTDDAGNPIVAFMKFDPDFSNARYVVARSQDFGASFLTDVRASGFSGGTVCDCCPAAVVSSGQTVAMLYRDNLNNIRDLWAGISQDGGQTFTAGFAVDESNWFIQACPSSGADGFILGDSLYAVFMSQPGGSSRCYFSRSSLSDLKVGEIVPITGGLSGISSQNYPRITHAGKVAAIVMKQSANGVNQLPLYFDLDITDAKPPVFESIANIHAANADVAMTGETICVVWEDVNSGTVVFRKGTYSTSPTNEISEKNGQKIYPNPTAQQSVTLVLDKKIASSAAAKILIFNSSGQQMTEFHRKTGDMEIQIDVLGWSPGIYFVKVGGATVGRFAVQP